MIKAVLFDIDGTITSLDNIFICIKITCRHFGLRVLTDEYIRKNVIGKTINEAILDAFPETAPKLDEIVGFYRDTLMANQKKYSPMYACVKPTFAKIRRHGIKVGLVTTKIRAEAEKLMALYHPIIDVLVAFEDEPHRKPNPAPIVFACKKLGVRPNEAVYVGDHAYDMIAAKRAGAVAVGVLGGFAKRKQLKEAGADYVIRRACDVTKILQVTR